MKNYTFFKAIYYKYTHFSKENIIEEFDNTPNWDNYNYCKISKVGDLIKDIIIKVDLKVNDFTYSNIDEKEKTYDEDYLTNFIFENENKLNMYINKIVEIVDINEFNTKLNDLNLLDMIEILKNFKSRINSSSISSSFISSSLFLDNNNNNNNNFIIDMDYVNNKYSNEFNNDLIDIKYTILNENFSFKKWDYFKLYHFMEYYETINSLNFLYENNIDLISKKKKIKDLNELEIFKLLDLRKKIQWNPFFAHDIFTHISLEIGNNTILEYCNLFYDLYSIYHNKFNTDIYKKMIFIEKENIITIYLPLLLKFYIPCISLKYNEITLNLKINSLKNLCQTDCESITIDSLQLYIDYIFLSKKERELFCTERLYYLIHTTERIISTISNNDFTIIDLEFNKICKQLFWFIYDNEKKEYLDSKENKFEIIIENEIIGNKRLDNKYYTYIEPWKSLNYFNKKGKNIMMYNFCIYPDNYQPSGFIDFKNFKSKKLLFTNSNLFKNKSIIIISYCIHMCKIENGFLTLLI